MRLTKTCEGAAGWRLRAKYGYGRRRRRVAANAELKLAQNTSLYGLMRLRNKNEKAGIKVLGLSDLIQQTRAGMSKEDIAWVEQQVAQAVDEGM